jgi:NDP-sugar pyrophosphorylase family protein
MQVAIISGGLAKRLGDLTRSQPKSMVRIWGRPFLEYQIEFLRKQGVTDIVLCIGHLGEQIESYFGDGSGFGVNIKYSHEDRRLGTCGALKNARDLLDNTFFTLYGDSYVFLNFRETLSFFESRDKPALMTVYKNNGRYDRSNTAVEGELVSRFSKCQASDDMVYVEYGVNIFRKEVLDMVPQGPYGTDELFERLVETGDLLAFEVRERFYQIGSPQGLEEFKRFAVSNLLPSSQSSDSS